MEELKNFVKGDVIYIRDDNPVHHGVISGTRPYVVVSNNRFNQFSPVLNVIPLTSRYKKKTPAHVIVKRIYGLPCTSLALCEQMQTKPKELISEYICTLPDEVMEQINEKIKFQLGL